MGKEISEELGRDESRHISCDYLGKENECPENCNSCAIAMKTNGDKALLLQRRDIAICQYKRALFVEPDFAEAWCNLANAYGMQSEYHNALLAFEKAIKIDPEYGKALFGRAITLKNLNRKEEALTQADEILKLYSNKDVIKFRDDLLKQGTKPAALPHTLQEAIDLMTDMAGGIIDRNDLRDENGKISVEQEIYQKVDFARKSCQHCARLYKAFNNTKIWNESIIGTFYASLCTTLYYYQDEAGFRDTDPFSYFLNHADYENLERKALNLLNIQEDSEEAQFIWKIIYDYAAYCLDIIQTVSPKSDIPSAVQDASESAYVIGMLYAMRHHEKAMKDQIRVCNGEKSEGQSELDDELDRLADQEDDCETIEAPSAMCYSPVMKAKTNLTYICDTCGQETTIQVDDEDGEEQKMIEKYQELAKSFRRLRCKASFKCYCEKCAPKTTRELPVIGTLHFSHLFVMTITQPESKQKVSSYLEKSHYDDFSYRVALAYLNGANTRKTIASATGTNLSLDVYRKHLENVLGLVEIKE